jgi:type II secretory pathway component PulJ
MHVYETLDIDGSYARTDGGGVHLVDLLAALALLGLVLSATLTILAQGQRAYTQGTARVESQQSARMALARMARELRQAGSGGGSLPPIAVAEAARVVIQHDLDGDGVASARGETVTWQLSAGVLRRNAGGGAQPIVNGVRALAFSYLDAASRPTTSLAAVRTVVIALTTEPEHPGAGGATLTKLTTEVRLRNR